MTGLRVAIASLCLLTAAAVGCDDEDNPVGIGNHCQRDEDCPRV